MLSQPAEKKENGVKQSNLSPEIARFFLAVLVAVVLIALGFFVYRNYLSGKLRSGGLESLLNYKELQLRPGERQNLERLIASISASSDPKEKAENLAKVFLTVSSDYASNPTEEKRTYLKDLQEYFSKNFPDMVDKYKLEIPCRQEKCGAVFVYSTELNEIKEHVDKNGQLKPNEKTLVLGNLDNAALESSTSKFNSLLTAFTSLKTFASTYGSEDLKSLAVRVGQLMKTENLEAYASLEKRGVLKLE